VDQKGKNLRIGAWILSGLGLLFLVISGYQYLSIRNKKMKWTPVTGVVVNYIVNQAEGGAAPVVIYVWEGDSISYTGDIYSSPPDFELLERVSMFVNPSSPDNAIIDTFKIYQLSLILGILGFVFNLIGLGILYNSPDI